MSRSKIEKIEEILRLRKIVVLLVLLLLTQRTTLAQVKINEFMIEPDQSVEILNVGTASADISGWYIDDSGGTTYYTIPQNSILYPSGCLVFSGSFNLNKSSADTVRLFNNNFTPTDPNAVLIDSFSYQSSPGQNISYSRIPDASDSWATASATLGKFNETGKSCFVTPTSTPIPTPTLVPSPQTTPTPTSPPSYNNIYISEAMVNPQSGEKEWLEIYNANDFSVELINWYIDDIENSGSQPYQFSLTIQAKEYKVIEFPTSIFNNTSDSVRLLDFEKELKDSFEYMGSEKGESWGRGSLEDRNVCRQEPSKGFTNNPCIKVESKVDTEEEEESEISTKRVASALTNLQPTPQIVSNASPSPPPGATVLGESVIEAKKTSNNLHKLLSFLSLSYSILTIFSLLFKIK